MADKKILIAVDGSENSQTAVLYVAGLLGGIEGFEAKILSVLPLPDEGYFATGEEKSAWLDSKMHELTGMLELYRRTLMESGFAGDKVSTELVISEGKQISSVIMEKQEECRAAALVIGRKGMSKSEEFLLGSVSNSLVHVSKCAVWVIEPACKTVSGA